VYRRVDWLNIHVKVGLAKKAFIAQPIARMVMVKIHEVKDKKFN
jgi:hypothetical protein